MALAGFLYEFHIGDRVHSRPMPTTVLRVPLNASPEQQARLRALQVGFAEVCNALAPLVQETRIWNRVALHHLAYRKLRAQFPAMGAQMVCNAIYSVSRSCRLVFQHPASPFSLDRLGDKPLPLLRFTDSCPVYFDRHTLSLKDGQLSMFTLDGRMRFQLTLRADDEAMFHTQKLREIVLTARPDGVFELSFVLSDAEAASEPVATAASSAAAAPIPEYLMVEDAV